MFGDSAGRARGSARTIRSVDRALVRSAGDAARALSCCAGGRTGRQRGRASAGQLHRQPLRRAAAHPDRVELFAVVDHAEIPTLQQPRLDTDSDGAISAGEAGRRAGSECAEVAAGVVVTVDGSPLAWSVQGAELTLPPGEAGLATTRVECRLTAPAELAEPATVVITDGYLADRIGWREITAVGDGVRLAGSEVPVASVSQELRSYPGDLLTDPLDVRAATLQVSRAPRNRAPGAAGPARRPRPRPSVAGSAGSMRGSPGWSGRTT